MSPSEGGTAGPSDPALSPRPLFSVVIPTRNTRELTLACLAALGRAAAAGEPPAPLPQVILVDDGGDDGTAEAAAAAHPELTVLQLPQAAGFTRAANRGLAAARGELLLLLNSDTEVAPGALAALAAAFATEPRLGIAGAALSYPDGRPQWSGGAAPTLLWLFGLASGLPALLGRLPLYRRLRPPGAAPAAVEWVTGAALALRRSALDEVGAFDERYLFYAQDLDLCLRMTAAGWRVALLPTVRVMHHHGATIGASGDGAGAQHPELLWTDLLRWAEKQRGAAWARRARRVLAAGAALRLAGRRAAALFLPAARRPGHRRVTAAYARARRAIAAAGGR